MRHVVKGLVLFLIFSTPVVGQEVGHKARGELIPASIHFELFPTSTVEGVLTSDLQLETEDGIIIAKDELINPEYFVVDRAKTVLGGIVGVTGLVALIEAARTCRSSADEGDGGWFPIPIDLSCSGYSWPLVIGLGVGIGIPLSFLEGMAEGEWKPW